MLYDDDKISMLYLATTSVYIFPPFFIMLQ